MTTFSRTLLLLASLAAACSGGEPSPAQPSGPDAGRSSSAEAIPPADACPGEPPAHSSACSQAGLRCDWDREKTGYGTSTAVCNGTFWVVARAAPDCPASVPGGSCGQFGGTCGYVVNGSYPAGGSPQSGPCRLTCDCYSGTWSCSNTCSCPGSPSDDPYVKSHDRDFQTAGCLNPGMQCEYRFNVGQGTNLTSDLATQPCHTTYTCGGSSWKRTEECACPAFGPQQRDVATDQCHGDSALECSFPARADGEQLRSCRCWNQEWLCR